MKEIKRIGLFSFAKIQTILMAIMGLILGLFDLALSLYSGIDVFPSIQTIAVTGMMGAWAVIFLPILYAILGFLFGFFGAMIYNLLSRYVGGVEIELADNEQILKKEKIKK